MSLESITISTIMNKNVKVEEQNQNIFAIANIMHENKIGSVVIIDNNKDKNPVGIVTEKDLIRIIGKLQPAVLQAPIKEHMSHPVITVSTTASIADVMKIMYEKKIRRIVIVEKNKMIGIVTEHDIFIAIIKNKDLLSSIIEGNLPIPQKQTQEGLTHFWFDNSFFKS